MKWQTCQNYHNVAAVQHLICMDAVMLVDNTPKNSVALFVNKIHKMYTQHTREKFCFFCVSRRESMVTQVHFAYYIAQNLLNKFLGNQFQAKYDLSCFRFKGFWVFFLLSLYIPHTQSISTNFRFLFHFTQNQYWFHLRRTILEDLIRHGYLWNKNRM